MKTVRMTQDRNFPEHGLKVVGQKWDVSDTLASQLEQQGFAVVETHIVSTDAEVKIPRKRAHESDGKFRADDPKTSKDEAYE